MNNLLSVISLIPEFRKGNHLVYPIDYLLLVAFCTMMCNQTSWHAMEDYAEIHQKDLRKLYFKISGKELRRYTPSHDVFCAVFQALSPVTLLNAFKSWLIEVYSSVGEHICIDGKTMRGAKKMEPDADCHTMTAYLSRIHASLDQVFIPKKSNEVKNFNIMSKIALFFVDKMKEKSGKRLITQFRTNAILKPSELLSMKL